MPIDWSPFVDLVHRHQRFVLTTHVRPDGDGLRLDHLYVVPAAQGLGVGGQVLGRLLRDADLRGLPVRVGAHKIDAFSECGRTRRGEPS